MVNSILLFTYNIFWNWSSGLILSINFRNNLLLWFFFAYCTLKTIITNMILMLHDSVFFFLSSSSFQSYWITTTLKVCTPWSLNFWPLHYLHFYTIFLIIRTKKIIIKLSHKLFQFLQRWTTRSLLPSGQYLRYVVYRRVIKVTTWSKRRRISGEELQSFSLIFFLFHI